MTTATRKRKPVPTQASTAVAPAPRRWKLVEKMADPARADGGYLTPHAVAELVGLHSSTIYTMIQAGQLPVLWVGKRCFISRRDVDARWGAVLADKPADGG